jgi:hypothetical protein
MKRNAWLAAALLLPLLVLGHGIWRHQSNLAAAQTWRIPISGYDPRDPLRGQYIRFNYDWALRGDGRPCLSAEGCNLCLSQEGDRVVATVLQPGQTCAAPVNTRASAIQVSSGFPAGTFNFSSRIFVSEASAPALEAQLRDEPMQVVAALGADGRLVNRRVEPAGR